MGLYPTAVVRVVRELYVDELKNKSLAMLGKQAIHMNSVKYRNIRKILKMDDSWDVLLKNGNIDSFEFFMKMGFGEVHAIDVNTMDGADIVQDLNKPFADSLYEKFDVVIDGGTLEHVFDISNAMKSIVNMTKRGGKVIHISPLAGYVNHGFYSFSPTLFIDFYEENGFEVEKIDIEFMNSSGKWDYGNYDNLTSVYSPDIRILTKVGKMDMQSH